MHNHMGCLGKRDWLKLALAGVVFDARIGVPFEPRFSLRCVICGRKHFPLMCPELTKMDRKEGNKSPCGVNDAIQEPKLTVNAENALTNASNIPTVFLQTLVVVLRGNTRSRLVRAMIDTGSQRSYILRQAAEEMGYIPVRQENIIHALFSGVRTEEKEHQCYKIHMSSLDGKYLCNLDALDQDKICGGIHYVSNGSWMKELKNVDIHISDNGIIRGPIEILLGADVAGKLLTGQQKVLPCGLVAIQTLLGWTLMGKVPRHEHECAGDTVASVVTSLFLQTADVSELWRLDSIGILDPTGTKSRQARDIATKEHFQKTMRINEEGRYEVCLPWIEGHSPLPTNRKVAMTRLQSTTRKLRNQGLYDTYEQVFTSWLEEGVIEEAPENTLDSGHYLPHHAVVRESSLTTPVRPVFDASAKDNDAPSLNQCLEAGPNLIELIAKLLMGFRKYDVGVVADIRRAFLQISVNPVDRDFLKFLWWDDVDKNKIKVYRHARVVFGVKCSPFLLSVVQMGRQFWRRTRRQPTPASAASQSRLPKQPM